MAKIYPYVPKKIRTNTKFYQKWGILAHDLAKEEGVTPDAIHMRVLNYGTPFQRKKAPTMCEVMTGKTSIQIAHELGVTPVSIYERLRNTGDAYHESANGRGSALRGTQRAEYHWTETYQAGVKPGCKTGWLHPRHPDYLTWRYKLIQKHCPTAHDPEEK